MNYFSAAPVIIIGMHRSGTSFFTRALRNSGVFLGKDLDSNDESTYFRQLDDWLLRQCDSSWANPYCFEQCRKVQTFHAMLENVITQRLNNLSCVSYWGIPNLMSKRFRDSVCWGWKDPRATYTLNFWLNIFPDTKIIAIRRNGLDVANSLTNRFRKYIGSRSAMTGIRSRIFNYLKWRDGFGDSFLSNSLERSFELWYSYERQVDRLSEQHGARIITLRYENFLYDLPHEINCLSRLSPSFNLRQIECFIQNTLTPNRVDAWKGSTQLIALGKKYTNELKATVYEYE